MSENTETTGAPEGYRPCTVVGCPRWMSLPEGCACLTCAKISEGNRVRNAQSDPLMWRPDWTPPIAQPPAAAHVGIDMAAPGSEHTAHRCTGCDWFIDTTCMADTQIAELVGAHMRRDHGSAHVERRAGQRWRLTQADGHSKDYTLSHRYGDSRWACVGFGNCGLEDVCWDGRYDMALLAKASPGPAKPCVCPHGLHTTDGKCPIHVTAGITVSGFADCACAKCTPPAQEAPKAAPVCGNRGCKTPTQNVAQRWSPRLNDAYERVGADLEWSCEPCHLLDEKEFAGLMTFESTGTPYAGPERLARPQPAADWVEDCLEDVR